jgi:16S rRNA (uracil1498-N3)-methyltransferase
VHRFYLPPGQCHGATLTLRDREAHHALRVVRVTPGERVIVLDGVGNQLHCEVRQLARHTVDLAVLQKSTLPPMPCQITLLQGLPKGRTFETIIQKATELGVSRIVPLLTQRAVVRLAAEAGPSKVEHWRQIAVEAIKQCGSPWLPRIETPLPPQAFIDRREQFDLALVAALQGQSERPRVWLEAYRTREQRDPQTVCLWIGPEGDFTPAELDAIRSAGAHPITLGRLVLRCETAALYCLSLLHYELQTAGDEQTQLPVPLPLSPSTKERRER